MRNIDFGRPMGPQVLSTLKVGFKFEGRSWYLVNKVDSIGLVGDIDSFGT